jgi:hypothetical protein
MKPHPILLGSIGGLSFAACQDKAKPLTTYNTDGIR